LVKLLGGRAAAAVMGLFMLALGSSEAGAQNLASLNVPAAVRSLDVDSSARPLGTAAALLKPAAAATIAMTTPAQSVTISLAPTIAQEAAWLYQNHWPLAALADRYAAGAPLDEQANCIATAVYFEARGEAAEGQLAVARVVMNRAASGKYPTSWCGVVKQPAQFSFVRHGMFPAVDVNSDAWRKAQGITRIALANAVPSLSTDVLWYHADYVAPSWGRRLNMVQKIGAHIFYRA
jgi:spore germination cell wall hydrolase CwlJ-like protein